VHPIHLAEQPANWTVFARDWNHEHDIPGALAMLAAGPSTTNPADNHRLEFLRVKTK